MSHVACARQTLVSRAGARAIVITVCHHVLGSTALVQDDHCGVLEMNCRVSRRLTLVEPEDGGGSVTLAAFPGINP